MNNRRKVLLGLGLGSGLAAWHKPMINSVVLPAHAQMTFCPEGLMTGNASAGPISGTPANGCTIEFEILSADPGAVVEVLSIDNTSTGDSDSVITVLGDGLASGVTGPRITWIGVASDGPFCSDVSPVTQPITDVTFTVTATCDDSATQFTQDFTLSSVLQ